MIGNFGDEGHNINLLLGELKVPTSGWHEVNRCYQEQGSLSEGCSALKRVEVHRDKICMRKEN